MRQVVQLGITLFRSVCTLTLAGLSKLKLRPAPHRSIADIRDASVVRGAEESLVGRQLGQYKLLRIVGRGGMGLVYKAQHVRLNKTVALKVLSAGRVQDPRVQDRFHREMHAAGQIEHPNVVQALDAAEAEGVHYLVMELVHGVDLSVLLKYRPRFSVGHACEMIRMAAVGLEQIHLAGMVHRDMKPGNLMLSRDGQIKILDLGLALLNPQYSTSNEELTSTGQLMGTVDYISPEQADNTHDVDGRADIYGLGATLFALLSGRAPFGGREVTLMKKLSLLANESAPSVKEFRHDTPDLLVDIVAKMLARNPQRRFTSAAEVAAALTPFCESSGLTDHLLEGPFELDMDADRDQDTVMLDSQELAERLPLESATTAALTRPFILRRAHWGLLSIGLIVILSGSVWLSRPEGAKLPDDTVDSPDLTPIAEAPSEATTLPVNDSEPEHLPLDESSRSVVALQRLAAQTETAESPSDQESGWSIFSASAEPDLRADAIHWACRIIPVERLVHQLLTENTPSIRAGLALALSEYDQSSPVNTPSTPKPASSAHPASEDLTDALLHFYVNDPNPEVHAAIDLLLRSRGQHDRLKQLRPLLEQKLIPLDGGWYVPLQMSTMVVIPGPRTEQIGSPAEEHGRSVVTEQKEDLRTVTIPYSFAICSTEVTQLQYWRSRERYWESPQPLKPDLPASELIWEDAAEFCNRLSLLEGLKESELCYTAVNTPNGVRWRQKENALDLGGYRLPTEDEWEIACRAGTTTSRPAGDEIRWMSKYAVWSGGMAKPSDVASRKPNAFGLFDMLGNVAEWMHRPNSPARFERDRRFIRGGSVWTPRNSLRSAARFHYRYDEYSGKVGFRVARTILKRPLQSDTPTDFLSRVEIQTGPPACPESIVQFAKPEFQPLLDDRIVEFGKWNGSNSPIRYFRIRNKSNQALKMSTLPWMNGAFVFEPPPPLEIAPAAFVEFGLRIPGNRVGDHTHDLRFRWEGVEELDFPAIRLHGCIEGPLLKVFTVGQFGDIPQPANLGTVPRGSQLGKRLFMWNLGDQPTEAAVATVKGPFTLDDPLEGKLLPQTMDKSFRVSFEASTIGPMNGVVTLKTLQSPPHEFSFPLCVNVIESNSFSSIGVFRDGTWFIDSNRDAMADETVEFGFPGDKPLTGDWNGDGICDIAVWRPTEDGKITLQFHLRGGIQDKLPDIQLESDKWTPVAADRDGDGKSEIGYVSAQVPGEELVWTFDTLHNATYSERFIFGSPGSIPVVGDWNGDGVDEVAVSMKGYGAPDGVRLWQIQVPGKTQPLERFYLSPFDVPLAGDWDGDGDDDLCGWRPMKDPQPCFWQFETTQDQHSECDLEGFGVETDAPFVLR